jgi:hypothetical protein
MVVYIRISGCHASVRLADVYANHHPAKRPNFFKCRFASYAFLRGSSIHFRRYDV